MTRLSVHSFVSVAAAALMLAASSVPLGAHPFGSLTNQQLALARAGTAQYHDLAQVLADGYTPMGFNPEEGVFEFVNFSLVDCATDPAQPEGLSFAASGNGLRLVGVEYAVPWACTAPGVPPQIFAGDQEDWQQEQDLPVWRLSVMLWAGSHDGPFGTGEEDGSTH